jgi:hypothetical protein
MKRASDGIGDRFLLVVSVRCARIATRQRTEADMPAKSKAQQMAAGAALAAKRGDQSPKNLKGASKSMYRSMDEKELHNLASTRQKNKLYHAGIEKRNK